MNRNRIGWIILFVFMSSFSYGQTVKSPQPPATWLKTGIKMIYAVDFYGKKYDFILEVKSLTPDLEFNWTMTAPVNKTGTELIKPAALKTATSQKNNFWGGKSLLTDKTCVWVSEAVYQALKKGGAIGIDPGNGQETLTFKKAEKMTLKLDDKAIILDVLYAETEKGSKYWIWDNPSQPIIFKMDLKWTIGLKEIKTK